MFRTFFRLVQGLFLLILFPALVSAKTFTVTNTLNEGAGSLRNAILESLETHEISQITFDFYPEDPNLNTEKGVGTIFLTSPLPDLSAPHAVQLRGEHKVILDGSQAKSPFPGLRITTAQHEVSGLTIQHFGGGGILIQGQDKKTVERVTLRDNRILDNGVFDENGHAGDGIRLSVNVQNTQIYDNLIARNHGNGIFLQSLTSAVWQNRIFGNFITGNQKNGIRIEGSRNLVGVNHQNHPAPNVITHNHLHGILLSSTFAHGNQLAYNLVGLGPDENKAGNRLDGVHLKSGARNNTIGPGMKIHDNGGGVVIHDFDSKGNEILENEITQNRHEGILLHYVHFDPPTKIQHNQIQENHLDGIHLIGASPDIWNNHISENQRYGIQLHPYDGNNPNVFDQDDLFYSSPDITSNQITRNASGGIYALDTIFQHWDQIEQKNEFYKNTDFDALVQWLHVFRFEPSIDDFGILKVEVTSCLQDKTSCGGNTIREDNNVFYIGPNEDFDPFERDSFFQVTHFIIEEGLRSNFSPHRIIVTGEQEKEFYLSDRHRAKKILSPHSSLSAQSVDDQLAPDPVHLTDLGTFGKQPTGFVWVWGLLVVLILYFLYHFWLAGHKIQSHKKRKR